jgi:hypothetical protein
VILNSMSNRVLWNTKNTKNHNEHNEEEYLYESTLVFFVALRVLCDPKLHQ